MACLNRFFYCWSCVGKLSAGFGQINGVCSPASACSSSTAGRVRPDPPRRSRSQGTRKLHKCLSTASYSEDCGSHSPGLVAPTGQRQQLLVARQYCSFGSTVTRLKINTATKAPYTSTLLLTLFTIHSSLLCMSCRFSFFLSYLININFK